MLCSLDMEETAPRACKILQSVEEEQSSHPQVDQCVVFALPDEKFGERVLKTSLSSDIHTLLVQNEGQDEDGKTKIIIQRAPDTMMKELRLFLLETKSYVTNDFRQSSQTSVELHVRENRDYTQSKL